jgi:hypothetical protein
MLMNGQVTVRQPYFDELRITATGEEVLSVAAEDGVDYGGEKKQ